MMVLWQGCSLRGHSGAINSATFFPDGKRVVSGSDDFLIKIWNAETAAEVSRERDFFIDDQLVQVHLIMAQMILVDRPRAMEV